MTVSLRLAVASLLLFFVCSQVIKQNLLLDVPYRKTPLPQTPQPKTPIPLPQKIQPKIPQKIPLPLPQTPNQKPQIYQPAQQINNNVRSLSSVRRYGESLSETIDRIFTVASYNKKYSTAKSFSEKSLFSINDYILQDLALPEESLRSIASSQAFSSYIRQQPEEVLKSIDKSQYLSSSFKLAPQQSLRAAVIKSAISQSFVSSSQAKRLLFTDVQGLIDSFNSSFTITDDKNDATNTKVVTNGPNICTTTLYECSRPTYQILNTDKFASYIYPGSVLQSKYMKKVLEGTSNVVPVSISQKYKQEIINITDTLGNIIPATNKAYDINYILAVDLKTYNQDAQVLYDWKTTDDLFSLAREWHLNAAIQKSLGIYRVPGSPLGNYEKRILFYFSKTLMIYKPNIPGTTLQAMYKQDLTLQIAQDLNSWSDGNPPVFISKAIYGGYMIMSAPWNDDTAKQYKQLKKNAQVSQVQTFYKNLASLAGSKFYSTGSFGEIDHIDIMYTPWSQFGFKILNKNPSTILAPYLYEISDFNQASFNIPNELKYQSTVCEARPVKDIWISLSNILGYAPVLAIIKYQNNNEVGTIGFSGDNTVSLNSYFGDNTYIIVSLYSYIGLTRWWFIFTKKHQRVTPKFLVNNDVVAFDTFSCDGSSCRSRIIQTYKINKYTGEIIVI